MRVHQMRDILAGARGPNFRLSLSAMPNKTRPLLQTAWANLHRPCDVMVFSKHTLLSVSPKVIEILKDKGIRLVFDHVDADMANSPLTGADCHMASSLGQLRWLETALGHSDKCHLVHHAYDTRLDKIRMTRKDRFSTIYCGSRGALHLPPELTNDVDIRFVHSSADMERTIPDLGKFAMHYAVRNDEAVQPNVFRPFTKGFTAAACGSIILAHRHTNDAANILGADYPYFCATLDDSDIVNAFDRAKFDFGLSDWHDAQERMRVAAKLVTPAALRAQFIELIEKALS